MNPHEIYMNRCLELARLGAGQVAPNPMVGSVLVHEDTIIGEGWHRVFGGPHAEINAIQSVTRPELISASVLYVNLEPCSHHGKTPPCAHQIVASGIKKVVIGMSDPNPLVAGKGIEHLKNAGIEVICGVLEKQSIELNRRFICYMQHKRPYVILKWAQTRNGFIAPDASKMSAAQFEEERHITGLLVQKLVHKWRTMEDAILVGTHTALLDNPALNARAWTGREPKRMVLDQHLRLPLTLKLFDGSQHTLVVNGNKEGVEGRNEYLQVNFSADWFSEMLKKLYDRGIQSLVVEGGATLLTHILAEQLWDEALVFYSPKNIRNGIAAPLISGEIAQIKNMGTIQMTQYYRA